ncbi:hypothetical protein GT035_15115 [Streptomyces sp. SID4913]|nr:hypothetical protein [Streptomyces sp. SID4913]
MSVGSRLWTLDGDRTAPTDVVGVSAVEGRVAVDVVTSHTTFTVAPDQLLRTSKPERHAVQPKEAAWVEVLEVRERTAVGKPFTFYGYRLDPYPTFLVNGHPARQAW